MEEVDIVYGHLVYFTDSWCNLWPFAVIYGHLVYLLLIWFISPVLVSIAEKNLATLIIRWIPKSWTKAEKFRENCIFGNKRCSFSFVE
jgi:hypothetical protein